MTDELPAPRFEHFERVLISGCGARCKPWQGARGTVVWLDSSAVRRKPIEADRWLYIVHLPAQASWKSFFQSELTSESEFEDESAFLGFRPEISFDLVLDEDNGWNEGSYRLPGEFWKVVIFNKDDVPEIQCRPQKWQRPTKWEREMTGVSIRFPRSAKMGRDNILQAMSHFFGYREWVQVDGPDSMLLR